MSAADHLREAIDVGCTRDDHDHVAMHATEVRAETLREAADLADNNDDCDCGGCDTCIMRNFAAELRQLADDTAPPSALRTAHAALAAQAGRDQAAIARVRQALAHADWPHAQISASTIRAALDGPPEKTEPPQHLAEGTNAEDCPACHGTNPPYPFLCPGPTEEPTP